MFIIFDFQRFGESSFLPEGIIKSTNEDNLKSGIYEVQTCYYMEVYSGGSILDARWECETDYQYVFTAIDPTLMPGGGGSIGGIGGEGTPTPTPNPLPIIDISGIKNNIKVFCIFQNLIKTAIVDYNPLVTSFLMNFSEDIAVNPEDIFFKLGDLYGAYGECDPAGNQYVVTLNINQINNRAPIEIAKTFIHEILHAQIGHSIQISEGSFIEHFGEYIKEKEGKEYVNQHELMMEHYLDPMIKFLKDYDSLSGKSATDEYYWSLAMSGLEAVISSAEMEKLTQSQNYFRQRGLTCE